MRPQLVDAVRTPRARRECIVSVRWGTSIGRCNLSWSNALHHLFLFVLNSLSKKVKRLNIVVWSGLVWSGLVFSLILEHFFVGKLLLHTLIFKRFFFVPLKTTTNQPTNQSKKMLLQTTAVRSRITAWTRASHVTRVTNVTAAWQRAMVPTTPTNCRLPRRVWFSSKAASSDTAASTSTSTSTSTQKGTGDWWHSAEVWGGLGALAGWGMSGAAIYDAMQQGPEVISLTMTPVLIVYSSLFARWAWIVTPQNLLLCGCHVTNVGAQLNQLRRALEHKMSMGQEQEVQDMGRQAAIGGAVIAGSIVAGPTLRSMLTKANLGVISTIAAADAGPFTVHFWAPISKWFISGASFLDLYRPTDNISLPQYTALTLTGFFFSRYALLVTPINYALCSVNIALFLSSAWHLGRKINADYIDVSPKQLVNQKED